ncbi:hypothetical protein [uncultured Adlercreutzia sp.]|uniref:hypothetical protein n=1 Tax=uncultured Adlercreutzia sp. TaxID=875803 RepID=UPI0025E3354B|nr:hypothetical protein [uncultured Adlercreutzia sp.]
MASREANDGEWPDAVLIYVTGETAFESSMAEGVDLESAGGYERPHNGYWRVDGVTEPGATVVVCSEGGVYRGCTLLNFYPS